MFWGLFSLALVYAMVVFTLNIFSYFDPLSLCYIGIDNDILGGNQGTIKKAIQLIKSEDEKEYKALCANIDAIIEQECINYDPHVTTPQTAEAQYANLRKLACYIKGSRVIYLPKEKNDTKEIIKVRAEMIKTYSAKNGEFWAQRPK